MIVPLIASAVGHIALKMISTVVQLQVQAVSKAAEIVTLHTPKALMTETTLKDVKKTLNTGSGVSL
jgi:uncharacterized protein (UPF0333 family)